MYLSELKLWNFRKYTNEDKSIDLSNPHLVVPFTKGLNILIGENDSGKSAIIDAVKLVLKTYAYEHIYPTKEDFNSNADIFRVELKFSDLSNEEAMHFTEWLSWEGDADRPILRLIYQVKMINDQPAYADICAGTTADGIALNAKAKDYLRTTYLRALRDAENELTAKKNSRLSQILKGHKLFQKEAEGTEKLESLVGDANEGVKKWFNGGERGAENEIKDTIQRFVHAFISENSNVDFSISGSRIKEILEKISIDIENEVNPGLGTLNRLYMATELLHIQRSDWTGLRLCLIEELEAHLHPQAQMKVIQSFQNQNEQYILTTHSPNLASKIKLSGKENSQVLICKGNKVFPMGSDYTLLGAEDYKDLENFLDVTRAGLFFAKGLILVEGWAEEILIPAICEKLSIDLTEREVTLINVGSTAYLKYAKIFMRKDKTRMGVPVSIITDTDVPAEDDGTIDSEKEREKQTRIMCKIDVADYPDIKWNLAIHWTLEWCLYKSVIIGKLFKKAAKAVHPQIFDSDDAFEKTLIERLRKNKLGEDGKRHKVDPIDKVAVAYKLASLIREDNECDWNVDDPDGINYLVNAIKHACRL